VFDIADREGSISYQAPDEKYAREKDRRTPNASPIADRHGCRRRHHYLGYAQTEAGTYQRPIVRHVNGVWGPIPDYGPLNVPYYASHYGPVAPVAAAADVAAATTCFAFSLIGAC
jgi:hypothetical protein